MLHLVYAQNQADSSTALAHPRLSGQGHTQEFRGQNIQI